MGKRTRKSGDAASRAFSQLFCPDRETIRKVRMLELLKMQLKVVAELIKLNFCVSLKTNILTLKVQSLIGGDTLTNRSNLNNTIPVV